MKSYPLPNKKKRKGHLNHSTFPTQRTVNEKVHHHQMAAIAGDMEPTLNQTPYFRLQGLLVLQELWCGRRVPKPPCLPVVRETAISKSFQHIPSVISLMRLSLSKICIDSFQVNCIIFTPVSTKTHQSSQ